VFHTSSAACTFCLAVSSVNGGTGKRVPGSLTTPRLVAQRARGINPCAPGTFMKEVVRSVRFGNKKLLCSGFGVLPLV
jgi:hypothetical protein